MKKLIISVLLISFTTVFSQVIIGGDQSAITDKSSVLLEFANDGNKGIILPYVTILPTSPEPGTILLDATIPTQARIKYFSGDQNLVNPWVDLSGQDYDVTAELLVQPVSIVENTNAKAIIGASSSNVSSGVLVLESKTKAMVLPIVEDVQNIIKPSPGMMVYLKKIDGKKRLAVFNGQTWAFWEGL